MQSDPAELAAEAPGSDAEAVYGAYREAKARHDAAITALRQASARGAAPDAELVRAQAEAAVEEIEALSAIRALVKPSVKPQAR